jgi:hypothetical protein
VSHQINEEAITAEVYDLFDCRMSDATKEAVIDWALGLRRRAYLIGFLECIKSTIAVADIKDEPCN